MKKRVSINIQVIIRWQSIGRPAHQVRRQLPTHNNLSKTCLSLLFQIGAFFRAPLDALILQQPFDQLGSGTKFGEASPSSGVSLRKSILTLMLIKKERYRLPGRTPATTLPMIFKLAERAQLKWRRLRGCHLVQMGQICQRN